MTCSRKRGKEALDTLLKSSTAQQMFHCCTTDQRLELLQALVEQVNDDDLHVLREEYCRKRSSKGRAMKRPVRDRSREAWLRLESCFYRHSEEVSCVYRGKKEKITSSKSPLKEETNLDARMVYGLAALFENRGQYLSKLCKCLGLEIEHL
jgi:hypothetical protein